MQEKRLGVGKVTPSVFSNKRTATPAIIDVMEVVAREAKVLVKRLLIAMNVQSLWRQLDEMLVKSLLSTE